MSQPNIEAERQEWYEQQKKKAFEEAGLVEWGTNNDGESEWIGTSVKWVKGQELLEQYLNEEY